MQKFQPECNRLHVGTTLFIRALLNFPKLPLRVFKNSDKSDYSTKSVLEGSLYEEKYMKTNIDNSTKNLQNIRIPSNPWSLSKEQITLNLEVAPENGLAYHEARKRKKEYGPNEIEKSKAKSSWTILIDQFKSLVIGVLAIAAMLSFIFGQTMESIAIIVAILINSMIGFFLELKAVRSMTALQQLGVVKTKVRRDGSIYEVDAQDLVPGDVVLADEGDIITADLRILEASKLQVNESTLTGESLPVDKNSKKLERDTALADRSNMLYKGTFLTRGSSEAIVVSTGMNTELGHISTMVKETGQNKLTPLEKRLNLLAYKLIWVTIFITVTIALIGILSGRELLLMIETAVALAIAAIPEGLPIVATIALAKGMGRMAQQNAIVNQLTTIETLGSTNIICTDKTGTLTENKMSVSQISFFNKDIDFNNKEIDSKVKDKLITFLEIGVLCNNASLNKESDKPPVGDPLEIALLEAGDKVGIDREILLQEKPEVREVSFDPELKMMATIHKNNSDFLFAVKGAPESLLKHCTKNFDQQKLTGDSKEKWLKKANNLAAQGLRIIGIAKKNLSNKDEDPYSNLTFLGISGMLDPPRQEVPEAIRECHNGGVKVIMITGDQALTAKKIGASVGLIFGKDEKIYSGEEITKIEKLTDKDKKKILNASIFARVSPKQKLNIISLHQKAHSIVAMTGDGVNDAPALKKADIGIAMGKRGSQVAKQAADMILQDDAFSTIVAAIKQGRTIFNNIRKFTLYLLSGNVGEIIAVSIAIITNNPLPLLPLQILYLNVVNDVFPALALGLGEGEKYIMNEPPQKKEIQVLTRRGWMGIIGYGLLISLTVFATFFLSMQLYNFDQSQAVTISFLTIAFARLWHVFNMRDSQSKIIYNEITRNKLVWAALGICTVLLLGAVYVPFLSVVLSVQNPGINGWIMIILSSLVPVTIGQFMKLIFRRRPYRNNYP